MVRLLFIPPLLLSLLFLTACIREDHFGRSSFKQIRYFTLENQSGNTQIIEDSLIIRLTVAANADFRKLRPDSVLLSSYARLDPGKDLYRDFSSPQIYTVYAEDGTSATYTVFVSRESAQPQLENTGLDDWYTPAGKSYQEPGAKPSTIWASGNAGVVTISTANVLPTDISATDKAAMLITRDLGSLGQLVGQRMGAGSLFTGRFELDIANPLNSTKFGIAFSARPVSYTLQYTYQPGTPYRNNRGTVMTKNDSCDIYLLLENRSQPDIKRIATGWFRSDESVSNFREIIVPLQYGSLPANAPAYSKPANGLFGNASDPVTHLTFVAASSASGALFEGGVNSTLVINNLRLNY
jgi:hypothetical protein